MIPERYRAYIYRVATAVSGLLVGYGLLSEEKAVLWMGLVNAAISGLAAKNTSTAREG